MSHNAFKKIFCNKISFFTAILFLLQTKAFFLFWLLLKKWKSSLLGVFKPNKLEKISGHFLFWREKKYSSIHIFYFWIKKFIWLIKLFMLK